ncbi:hypothetical protein F5880DRAFT_1512542 [Lentinula raphanica]|nr:hypothetical protein F5880DRAFT_1512542 [Lentinula raphanica]
MRSLKLQFLIYIYRSLRSEQLVSKVPTTLATALPPISANSDVSRYLHVFSPTLGSLFSSQMSNVCSGGIIFSYFPTEITQGQFAMVNISSHGKTVTTGDDFSRLEAQVDKQEAVAMILEEMELLCYSAYY